MSDEEAGHSSFLVVTALRDEAVHVLRGLSRSGYPSGSPFSLAGIRQKSCGGRRPRRRRIVVAYSGPGSRGRQDLSDLLNEGIYKAVFFCGLAGSLSPQVVSGEIVVASSLQKEGAPAFPLSPFRPPFENGVLDRIHPRTGPFRRGMFLSTDRLVTTPWEKSRLRQETGADVVDMESHGWTECALKAMVPFLVFRVISDGAGETLPQELLDFVSPAGETSLRTLFLALLSRPSLIRDLWSMKPSIAKAHASLSDLGEALGRLIAGLERKGP